MPSLRALGLGLVLLLQVVTATPVARPAVPSANCKVPGSTPTLPSTGGPTDLPAPNAGLTLQYVAIGRGIQNYTCSAVGAVPVQQGAKATLFDATTLAKTNENLLHSIPAIVVYWPLPSDSTAQLYNLPVLGHHYFDSASTPTFDLTAVNKIGFMQKTVGVAAPAGANIGPDKTSAVPWLDLNNKPGYVSKSITQVYRVETAGGNPYATCNSTDLMEIEYAAEYWFYN